MCRWPWTAMAIAVVSFALGSLASSSVLQGRQPINSIEGSLGHVGIVVKDVDAAAKRFAAVFGVSVNPGRTVRGIPFPPGSPTSTMNVKVTRFTKNNITFELLQPLDGPSPWKDFLDRRGEGVHHIEFDVDSGLDETVQFLQRHGGTWVQGNSSVQYAYVDMSRELGFTMEIIAPGGPNRR